MKTRFEHVLEDEDSSSPSKVKQEPEPYCVMRTTVPVFGAGEFGEPMFPIQDNGEEIPDYSRGGDGPPSPWCKRCKAHHWNRCPR